jgi:hypothetical protein
VVDCSLKSLGEDTIKRFLPEKLSGEFRRSDIVCSLNCGNERSMCFTVKLPEVLEGLPSGQDEFFIMIQRRVLAGDRRRNPRTLTDAVFLC